MSRPKPIVRETTINGHPVTEYRIGLRCAYLARQDGAAPHRYGVIATVDQGAPLSDWRAAGTLRDLPLAEAERVAFRWCREGRLRRDEEH